MLTKQERILLRSLSTKTKTTIWVGKEGFSSSIYEKIGEELNNHELVKISILNSTNKLTSDELGEIATKLGADIVATIGKKIVLYKYSEKDNFKHIL
ncbi:MAG: YhbY family RNA-binding protein [Clostridia bacterium]|nr:YhbY family RNA-binding protein [Clostridia bacterium]